AHRSSGACPEWISLCPARSIGKIRRNAQCTPSSRHLSQLEFTRKPMWVPHLENDSHGLYGAPRCLRTDGTFAGAAALRVVGVRGAPHGTVGAALLASLFPPKMRGTVLGAFLAAGMMGSVLGVVLGGFIAERWGWQAGFGAVGIPGLVLCVAFLLIVRDYKTVALPSKDYTATKHRLSARAVVAELLRPRTALITCVGAGLNLLVVSTIWAWLPSY